jgi:hypothetical protein
MRNFGRALALLFGSTILACAGLAAGCSASDSGADGDDGPTTASADGVTVIERLDLTKPADNLKAFVKVRGSLDPQQEVVFYWSGTIYSLVAEPNVFPPQKTNKRLFRFEGFNVARFVPTADGYQMLSREAAFYEDPDTGEILDCWRNPLNGKDVSVLHVWNDPVNFDWKASTWTPAVYQELGGKVMFASDVLLAYPSPLPVASYPEYSAGNTYQGVELFNFYTPRAALDLAVVPSAPADISWTRIGQYLPWMQMGQDPGFVVYQTRGQKLMGGYSALPAKIRDFVEARKPEFARAPTDWPAGQRNMTSWTYFRTEVAAGRYEPTCSAP